MQLEEIFPRMLFLEFFLHDMRKLITLMILITTLYEHKIHYGILLQYMLFTENGGYFYQCVNNIKNILLLTP